MHFYSTRGGGMVEPASAVRCGIAPDGGLFVPEAFPKLSISQILDFADCDYPEIAAEILSLYFTDLKIDSLRQITARGYGAFLQSEPPLVPLDQPGLFAMELFHGPTSAFKDYALCVLPGLLSASNAALGVQETSLILVATSGDTGKAAMAGFADWENTAICVFYPKDGVSAVQLRQMQTQKGKNLTAIGLLGNFDDCQTGVKRLMADEQLSAWLSERGMRVSSANSINFGRLAPQIAYYFSAYARLCAGGSVKPGEAVDFVVPTGNFGDILAGWYAKQMGLPVGTLVCASNQNDVLTQFFRDGRYRANKKLIKTTSPSMDILVSSNLERLLYHVTGDAAWVREQMQALAQGKDYTISSEMLARLREDFAAGCATDEQAAKAMEDTYQNCGVVLDPHSACGKYVYDTLEKTGRPTVLLCTASPFKFAADVVHALFHEAVEPVQALGYLAERTGLVIPKPLQESLTMPLLHTLSCAKDEMEDTLKRWIGNGRTGA